MGFTLLVLGVLVWSGSHLWKRLAPAHRARFGEGGKGIVSILSLIAIVLMVLGYRWAPYVQIWPESRSLVPLNNLLMLLSFYLFAASGMKTAATRIVRHPQLWGARLWALAHLMVNGDLASLILFGGLFAWAQVEVALYNRDNPVWDKSGAPAAMGKEIGAIVGAVLLVGIVGYIHIWLGLRPWG
ncbi:MAG: NnrU family protein [Rhodobacteraceae bacterium]|nr:NnrU family protein [Paracoccaceae bacterium]